MIYNALAISAETFLIWIHTSLWDSHSLSCMDNSLHRHLAVYSLWALNLECVSIIHYPGYMPFGIVIFERELDRNCISYRTLSDGVHR